MPWVHRMHAVRTTSTSPAVMKAEGAKAKKLLEGPPPRPGYIDSEFTGNPVSRNVASVSRWQTEADLDAATVFLQPYTDSLYTNGYIERPAVITKHPEP